MSKFVMSGGAHSRGLAPEQSSGQHSMKKRRSSGDPLATLFVYNLTFDWLESRTLTSQIASPIVYSKLFCDAPYKLKRCTRASRRTV